MPVSRICASTQAASIIADLAQCVHRAPEFIRVSWPKMSSVQEIGHDEHRIEHHGPCLNGKVNWRCHVIARFQAI